MIEHIRDLPSNVLGFRAVGTVDSEDYRLVVDPAIDEAVARNEKINIVYVIGDQFERFTLGALWQDALLEGKPMRTWGRIALVTDSTFLGEAIHAIAFAFPFDLKFFPVAQEAEAIEWAGQGG